MWIVATNNLNYPIIAIMGQRQDSSLSSAQNNNVWSSVILTNLPSPEFRILYRLIYEVRDNYTNQYNAALRDIVDMRNVNSSLGGATVNDHGVLAGLGDDDHYQYLHIVHDRIVTASHTFSGTTNLSTIHVSTLVGTDANISTMNISTIGAMPIVSIVSTITESPIPSNWKPVYYDVNTGAFAFHNPAI
jgi:hypothetical protein